jgi:hypothetical protein
MARRLLNRDQLQISRVSTTVVSLPNPAGIEQGAAASNSAVRPLICCCKLNSVGRATSRRSLIQAGRCLLNRFQVWFFHQ